MSDSERSSPGPERPIEIYLDAETAPRKVLTGPPYRLELDTTELANGEHTVRLVRTDEAGVRQEQSFTIQVDNPTTFEVTGIEPGARVAGTLEVDITARTATSEEVEHTVAATRLAGPSPWWYIGVTAVVFIGIWLFFLLVPTYSAWVSNTPAEAAASAADAETMAVGESLYATNCSACHKEDGAGMGTAIPALAGNAALADAAMVVSTIAHGTDSMMAFSSLDAQQLASLATYVRNSWGNAFGPVTADEASAASAAGATAEPEAAPAPAPEQPAASTSAAEAAPAPAATETAAPAPAATEAAATDTAAPAPAATEAAAPAPDATEAATPATDASETATPAPAASETATPATRRKRGRNARDRRRCRGGR